LKLRECVAQSGELLDLGRRRRDRGGGGRSGRPG